MPNSGVWLQRRACSVSGCVRRLQGTDGSLTWVGITWLSEWCLYDATNFLAQQGPQLLCFICKKSRSLGSENLKDFSWRSCHKVLKCNENVPNVLFLVKVSICWKDGQIYFCFQLLSWFSFWDSVSVSQVVYLAEVNLELVILCLHSPDAGITGMWDQAWHIGAFKCNFLWIPFLPLEFSSGPISIMEQKKSFSWGKHVDFVCFFESMC